MSLSNQDKNMCIVVAHKIIDDYIRKVILTGEYRGESSLLDTSQQDKINTLGMLLCQAITRIERINNPQYPTLVLTKLNEYLQLIPQYFYRMLGTYNSSEIVFSDDLKDIFQELNKSIHVVLPFYKGFSYEIPYMIILFTM
jgi:hypothetical protein